MQNKWSMEAQRSSPVQTKRRTLFPMRSHLLTKLALSYSALILITGLLTGIFLHHGLSKRLKSSTEASLTQLSHFISSGAQDYFLKKNLNQTQTQINYMSKSSGVRITLIRPDGVSWVDSEGEKAHAQNHSQDPEVIQALSGKTVIVRRFSHLLNQPTIYIAQPLYQGEKIVGVTRLSLPTQTEEQSLKLLSQEIIWATFFAIVIAILLGIMVSRRLLTPIREMLAVAIAMRKGDFSKKVHTVRNDELGGLGKAINKLGKELSINIDYLTQEESKLRVILSNMREGVIALDQNDIVLFCNAAAMKMLSQDIPILPGKRIWEFTQLREISNLVQEVKTLQKPKEKELHLTYQDQEVSLNVKVQTYKMPKNSGIMVVVQDTTHLRKYEKVRREFVANVSHELKTPLTSIRGYVETLLDGAIDDKENNRRFLQKIQNHASQLTHLVEDILQIGQIESSHSQLSKRHKTSWSDAVEIAIAHSELEAQKKNIQIQFESTSTPTWVMASQTALTQMASNLISNAVRYSSRGGKIHIRILRQNPWGVLEVSDTGIGIPPQDLPRIFERFYRVDHARSRELGGTGLGLAIVKHLSQSVGGDVSVSSQVGIGSSFRVKIPLFEPK